jgi:hypothetical protein
MGKVWVLDTETKGTGANMVPLERALKKPAASAEPLFVPRKPRPRPPEMPKPRAPHRFRVVDVMTRQVLVDGAPAREAIDALAGFRSTVDFSVYVWTPTAGVGGCSRWSSAASSGSSGMRGRQPTPSWLFAESELAPRLRGQAASGRRGDRRPRARGHPAHAQIASNACGSSGSSQHAVIW